MVFRYRVVEQIKSKYLENNNLEIEFNNLIYLKKGNAVKELDTYTNPKRDYLRELISNVEVDEIIKT